ncbi:TIGR02594 family protein [Pseudomonas sp. GX19020]|uniref:NlpC/P60 family protein n=1 Tax=Pseudomonas sp. GX19020 TaxID=2942277 RepID=UPI0020186E8D|nr:TIGR02594 family protein [Pseudomonas sp. GX19020]MCL4065908.1 TIGR02594 family protein [Pseudomonas sp. GX19020]
MSNATIQTGLRDLGYQPGAVDGIFGPRTKAAAEAWLAAGGTAAKAPSSGDLPWMTEGKRVLGRHEVRDNGLLRSWLKSDGKTLGDPAKLPWCGDFVETCIRLALPGEPFPGSLGQNPYWARNWLELGQKTNPTYGAVLVFERGSGGHVGFAVGADPACFHVLGGNQSNAVTIARIDRKRLLGARWPKTFAALPLNLPSLSASDSISTNEA